MNAVPLIPDVGILALVPDRWGTFWTTRHHLLTWLARYFNVVWVDPAHEWRHVLSIRHKHSIGGVPADSLPGFAVYTPEPWLPKLYRPRRVALRLFRYRIAGARRMLLRRGCQKVVLYIWRPEFADAVELMPFDLTCYHIDDEYSFSDLDLPLDPAEARLISRVDHVFVHSLGLMEKKGHLNPHTTFVPNGVDYHRFAALLPEPPDLASIPRPRIGYAGIIRKQLDWELLRFLITRHPEWSFVFVGPCNQNHPQLMETVAELSRSANVYYLGAKSAHELASYPQHFDVCIMPYRLRIHSERYGYPLKLHEYLASGRPTVGAPLRSLKAFADVVSIPESCEEWESSITQALTPAAIASELKALRQATARQHDWEILALLVAKTMIRRLRTHVPDPVLQLLSQVVEPDR